MTAQISHTTFDSRNAYAQSMFWAKVLGFSEDPDDPNEPGHEECMIFSPDGAQRLLFQEVPEGKQVKNRVHLDVRAAPGLVGDARMGALEAEAERLVALGATRLERHEPAPPMGAGHLVLADPEGNEFCLD